MVDVVADRDEWFELWHVHPNTEDTVARWAGLVAAWAQVEATGQAPGRPWQTWLVIEPADPREDAAYLHTPNPNRDDFPYPFEGVKWGAEPPGWVVASDGLQFGRSNCGGTELLWVRRPHDAESVAVPDPVHDWFLKLRAHMMPPDM